MARKSRVNPPSSVLVSGEKRYQVALYVRLSVLDGGRKDRDTVRTQELLLRNFIQGKPEFSLYSVYVDNGQSGVNFERDDWKRLLDDVKQGRVNCIIVKDLSRFGRNYIEAGEYLEKVFPFLGVRFIAVNDQYDSLDSSTSDYLAVHLKNLINDVYARDISHKICPVLRNMQEQGRYIGSMAAYGYKKSERDRHILEIDPEAAQVVRSIFQWRVMGLKYSQITRELRRQEIPSPNRYRYEKGIMKDPRMAETIWKNTTVQRILSNQIYLGHMVQGRKRAALWKGEKQKEVPREQWSIVPDTHEAIIDPDTFWAVQRMGERTSEERKSRSGRFCGVEHSEDILEGLLFCGRCGKKLIRHKTVRARKSAGAEPYIWYGYVCPTHRVYPEGCSFTGMSGKELEACVYETVKKQLLIWGFQEERLKPESGNNSLTARTRKLGRDIETAAESRNRLARHKESLYDDYADGLLSEAEYLYAKERYQKQDEALQCRIYALRMEEEEAPKAQADREKWSETTALFQKEPHLTKAMAQELIACIILYDKNRIQIHFRFGDGLQNPDRGPAADLGVAANG